MDSTSMDMDSDSTLEVEVEGAQTDRRPLRHRSLFFDQNMIIRVHTTLYSIPEYLLRGSTLFETLFTLDPGPDASREGLSVDNPIDLSSADPLLTEQDFDRFVTILTSPIHSSRTWSVDELDSALMLARKWEFQQLETYARSRILKKSLTTAQMISVGARHEMTELLLDGYVAACCRPAPLSAAICHAMARALPTERFLDLCKARRAVRRHIRAQLASRNDTNHWSECLEKPNYCHTNVKFKSAIRAVLNIEEENEDAANDRKTFEAAFHDELAGPACVHCAPKEEKRLLWFVGKGDIRTVVKDIMIK